MKKRKCKCKYDMIFVGFNADGKYWCPNCGRFSQSFVCEPTSWFEPEIINKLKQIKNLVLVKDKKK